MDVLARLSSLDDADLFGACMALDLPGTIDCSDLPSPALPEGMRQRDRMQHLEATTQPAQLQIPESYAMDLQECLASPAFEATLFGLTDQLSEFNEQFMDAHFAFDMPSEHAGGDMADMDNTANDLSSRVSKESSAEVFHDTPLTFHNGDTAAITAHSLGANSFTTLGASQWPCSYPTNFIPAQGFGSVPVSCPSSSSSYAQPPAILPCSQEPGGAGLQQGLGSGAANQSLASMLDALDSPTSFSNYSSMPDFQQAGWGSYDGSDADGLHRQSESGSSGQAPSRSWQPLQQRKAVKRSLGRSKSGSAAADLLPDDLLAGAAFKAMAAGQQQAHPSPDPFAFPLPKLPPILARPADCGGGDTSREGTPTPTAQTPQTEWLRIQMMKLMSSTPGCAAVPLRNLMNSPRAHSQPNSPRSSRSPRSRSRPGTPKSRTPRGTSTKTVFQPPNFLPNPNPSRLGVVPNSPTQRSKVARAGNADVSSGGMPMEPAQPAPHHQHYAFAQHLGSALVSTPSAGAAAEQASRAHHVLQQAGGSQPQAASTAAAAAAAAAAAVAIGATTQGPCAGPLTTTSDSRPKSGESDKSTSSTAEVPSLEAVLDQLAGNRTALEAGGRLLHLQRSFSSGLTPDAVEHVLLALRHEKKVEVVYFPNIPMVLSEAQVELLLTTLQKRHIWALSLGEGTSLTAQGWDLLATRLQTTALAYLYVSPATQASIPPTARACIRDGLHANRRAAPPRDPVLLAQMQVMSSTPQQSQAQAPTQQLLQRQPAPAAQPGQASMQAPAPAAGINAALGAQTATSSNPAQGPNAPAAVQRTPSNAPTSTAMVGGSGAGAAHTAGPTAPHIPGATGQELDAPAMQQESSQTSSSGNSPAGVCGADTTTEPTSSTASPTAPPPAPLEFADLVAVGYVQPGQYHLTVAAKLVEVSVLPTGCIQWEGMDFATLGAFVQAVACKQQLPCAQPDPWKEVLLHGISLDTLRQAFIERQQ